MRPRTLDGDWNRLYSEFPEVYDEFASVAHVPSPVDVIASRFGIDGKDVIDVGAGSGRSTIELADRARRVVGIEPNPSMLAVARERAVEAGVTNVHLLQGDAASIPCDGESADVVTCLTTVFWPPEKVIPAFVVEAQRVLRDDGLLISVNTRPGWYGGELRDFVTGDADEYETGVSRAFAHAGLETSISSHFRTMRRRHELSQRTASFSANARSSVSRRHGRRRSHGAGAGGTRANPSYKPRPRYSNLSPARVFRNAPRTSRAPAYAEAMDEISRQAIVKLYVETRNDAERAAEQARAEGFSAEVGRPLVGDSWAVTVSGDPDAVLAFGERIRSHLNS
jgi:ubiquinone/menaquinone biosynthesis C-methylase UbiE